MLQAVFVKMHKKGVSIAVAWVLLLGLSIALAILVGTWLKEISKDTGDEIVATSTKDQLCADTILAVVDYNCSASATPFSGVAENKVIFKNAGYFNITKIKCKGNDLNLNADGSPLAPGMETQPLNNCFDASLDITYVVPFIGFNGEQIACAEKSVKIVC